MAQDMMELFLVLERQALHTKDPILSECVAVCRAQVRSCLWSWDNAVLALDGAMRQAASLTAPQQKQPLQKLPPSPLPTQSSSPQTQTVNVPKIYLQLPQPPMPPPPPSRPVQQPEKQQSTQHRPFSEHIEISDELWNHPDNNSRLPIVQLMAAQEWLTSYRILEKVRARATVPAPNTDPVTCPICAEDIHPMWEMAGDQWVFPKAALVSEQDPVTSQLSTASYERMLRSKFRNKIVHVNCLMSFLK